MTLHVYRTLTLYMSMRQQDDKEAENMSYYGTTINDSAVIVVKAGEEIPAPAFLAVGADG